MSKHDLPARPVFHHTRDATWAHLTVVMASLAVARYLQDTTGISIARIVREHAACRRSTSTSTATKSLLSPSSPRPQPESSNPYRPQGTKAS